MLLYVIMFPNICYVNSVFGGTPWDMMSFLLLLMDWRGYTNDQIALLQITSGKIRQTVIKRQNVET